MRTWPTVLSSLSSSQTRDKALHFFFQERKTHVQTVFSHPFWRNTRGSRKGGTNSKRAFEPSRIANDASGGNRFTMAKVPRQRKTLSVLSLKSEKNVGSELGNDGEREDNIIVVTTNMDMQSIRNKHCFYYDACLLNFFLSCYDFRY